MNFFKQHKNIILGLIAVVLLFVGYVVLFGGEDDGAALTSESPSGESAVGSDLLTLLLELNSLELNATIFENPLFQQLQDFSQELVPEPVGRNNPFAPVGSDEPVL